ncbi:MAG: transposase [Zoogloeaceae bacterium]|nr:transposase [Zoogloeaceae bacterium]
MQAVIHRKTNSDLKPRPQERCGGQIVVADRFFPSRKTCPSCGHKLAELPLSARMWDCYPQCGTQHDRDVNAAINSRNNAVSSTVSACGEKGSGHCRKTAAT